MWWCCRRRNNISIYCRVPWTSPWPELIVAMETRSVLTRVQLWMRRNVIQATLKNARQWRIRSARLATRGSARQFTRTSAGQRSITSAQLNMRKNATLSMILSTRRSVSEYWFLFLNRDSLQGLQHSVWQSVHDCWRWEMWDAIWRQVRAEIWGLWWF